MPCAGFSRERGCSYFSGLKTHRSSNNISLQMSSKTRVVEQIIKVDKKTQHRLEASPSVQAGSG